MILLIVSVVLIVGIALLPKYAFEDERETN